MFYIERYGRKATRASKILFHVGKSVSTLLSVVRNILILLTALSAAGGGVTDRYECYTVNSRVGQFCTILKNSEH